MKIILASSSPRRIDILQNIFDDLIIRPPFIDEKILPNDFPIQFSERTSKEKAESVAKLITGYDSFLIISCDTIVTIKNRIIGKPSDLDDAINIIQTLNGREHEVISSITLLYEENKKIKQITSTESTCVKFKTLNDKEIVNYLNLINYIDKAGAYAIQEHGELIINSIQGSLTNVIGFPLRLFFSMLSEVNLLYII